jgi:hypothetical protein
MDKSAYKDGIKKAKKGSTYEYCGSGRGVPGIPNLVTTEEAIELGALDILQSALTLGVYQESKKKKQSQEKPQEEPEATNDN